MRQIVVKSIGQMKEPIVGKPLFIAPIDLHENDEITLLFGKPILIKRAGQEIWRDPMILDARAGTHVEGKGGS